MGSDHIGLSCMSLTKTLFEHCSDDLVEELVDMTNTISIDNIQYNTNCQNKEIQIHLLAKFLKNETRTTYWPNLQPVR